MCDGSFDIGYGTAGWCIDGSSAILRGVNRVPIGSDSLDATRCELAGIYTVLRIIECLAAFHNIPHGSVEVGCDCEGGLKRTLLRKKIQKWNYVNGSHLDLINPINKICSKVKFNIVGRHVPGHQDEHCVYELLDWWGQRNVDMDILVKSLMFARRKSKKKIRRMVYLYMKYLGLLLIVIKYLEDSSMQFTTLYKGRKLWNIGIREIDFPYRRIGILTGT